MKKEFTLAFNEVLTTKQLPQEVVVEAIESAMVSAYRKSVNASNAQQVTAEIDPEHGGVKIFAEKEVVEDIHDDRTEVLLSEAREYEPDAELGDMVMVESTPRDFGRVAAQTARQVIQQRMREAERDVQFQHFSTLVGEIVNGIVQATNPKQITLGLDKKAEGIMPYKEQIRGERFRVHDRVRALLAEVKQSPRGPQIILSRSHKNFLRRLLEDEVPEIYNGLVEIRSISREPGQRSKVAVSAVQPGIDPVGACVGVRGVRIQAIVRELNDEKIDVIEWNPDPSDYIAKALSPARVVGVFLNRFTKGTKTATVVVPEDQLSLAIGRDGQNARLAAKLTGWRIDIKSVHEAAADAVHKLQTDLEFADIIEIEEKNIPAIETILTKKAEGRPIPPEEYQTMAQFVTRVENRLFDQREADKQAELEHRAEVRARIPAVAFETPLEELEITLRRSILLGGEGYSTIGDLLYQLELDPDEILALNGIGPKAMEEIEEAVAMFLANPPEPAEPAVAEAEAEAEAETDAVEEAPADELQAVEEVPEEAVEEPAAVEAPEVEAVEETAETPAEGVDEAPDLKTELAESGEVETDDEKSFDDLFTFTPEDFGVIEEEEEGQEEFDSSGKKKKKRRKRFVEVEYDPDLDITIVKRKRKRGGKDEWMESLDEDNWD